MRRIAWACLALAAAGCATDHSREVTGSAAGHGSVSLQSAGAVAPPPAPDPNAARRVVQIAVVLDIYRFTAPAGAISDNIDFWKRVDEDSVDVGAHDLLLRNGIRFGLGRTTDWPWFKDLLGRYPTVQQTLLQSEPGKEGYVEFAMRTGVPEQTVFGLDDQGVDWGRRFEKCDDLLGISYIASTHNPGQTIVKVCPIIRGLRVHYHVSVLNNEEQQIEPKHLEHLYDMRLQAAIPLGDFLIVAPSDQSRITTSLGATFLTDDGKADPVEHALIIVPRPMRLEETPGD